MRAMHPLAKLDREYLWHPFTQMRGWRRREPIVIVSGSGAELRDAKGRVYLDGNSSIWTNLHGHNDPVLNEAIERQLAKISHSSALGLANEPASLLGERLIRAAQPDKPGNWRGPRLSKVFYSDDGSTALEVALKLAYEVARRTGRSRKPRFLSMAGAYHGDTVGAVSLGHIDLFHKAYGHLLFKSDSVMAPYCYRCPYNRAKPERADARTYRRCDWECVGQVERAVAQRERRGQNYAGFVYEPLMQGAAGMVPQPAGWLKRVAGVLRDHGAMLVADEVMTGFGRCGVGAMRDGSLDGVLGSGSKARQVPGHGQPSLFASHQESVQPDFLCLAKGMTGGYLPMAATLTTSKVFRAFLGEYEEFKTFFHGHSYTANQLGAAASLASLRRLQTQRSLNQRWRLERVMAKELARLWELEHVGDIRQVGLVAGIELVDDWRTRRAYPLKKQAGMRVCEAMAARGVLTRPIGNVVVLMPPYCTTEKQMAAMVGALAEAVREVL